MCGWHGPTSWLSALSWRRDPLFYFLSGRKPAIPLLATWFPVLPERWTQLLALLEEARPPYIFVATGALESEKDYNPGAAREIDSTMPLIEKDCDVLRKSGAGTWDTLRGR